MNPTAITCMNLHHIITSFHILLSKKMKRAHYVQVLKIIFVKLPKQATVSG